MLRCTHPHFSSCEIINVYACAGAMRQRRVIAGDERCVQYADSESWERVLAQTRNGNRTELMSVMAILQRFAEMAALVMDHTSLINAVALRTPATVIRTSGTSHWIGIPMDARADKKVNETFTPVGKMKRATRASPTTISLIVSVEAQCAWKPPRTRISGRKRDDECNRGCYNSNPGRISVWPDRHLRDGFQYVAEIRECAGVNAAYRINCIAVSEAIAIS